MKVSKGVRKYLSTIGKKGGYSTSEKKAASSRRNGLLAANKIKAKKVYNNLNGSTI